MLNKIHLQNIRSVQKVFKIPCFFTAIHPSNNFCYFTFLHRKCNIACVVFDGKNLIRFQKSLLFWFLKKVISESWPSGTSSPHGDSQGWVESHGTLFFGFPVGNLGHVWKSVKIEVWKIEKLKIFENWKFKCTNLNTYDRDSWPPNIRFLGLKMLTLEPFEN